MQMTQIYLLEPYVCRITRMESTLTLFFFFFLRKILGKASIGIFPNKEMYVIDHIRRFLFWFQEIWNLVNSSNRAKMYNLAAQPSN